MEIQFKVSARDFSQALDAVSVVTPKSLDPQGGSGYLVVVKGNKAQFYSRDATHAARTVIHLAEVEGEGSFIYPAAYVGGFQFLSNTELSFTVSDEDGPKISYRGENGVEVVRSTYDPRLLSPIDKDVAAAKETGNFSPAVLIEALSQSKSFTAKPTDPRAEEEFKGVQVFDASTPEWEKGNGCLYASNGVEAFYFYSPSLENRGFAIHGQQVPLLLEFLKNTKGEVKILTGQNMTYASVGDRILGWTHHLHTFKKYTYPKLEGDQFRWRVSPQTVRSVLQYVLKEMDAKNQERVKLIYDSKERQISFSSSYGSAKVQTFPIPVVEEEGSLSQDLTVSFNIHHLFDVFTGLRGHEVELRLNRKSDTQCFIRTVEEYTIDADGKVIGGKIATPPEGAHECRVTRLAMMMT